MKEIILVTLMAVLASCQPQAYAGPLDETRYCGTMRDADGQIKRSSTVRRWFQLQHPCPSTMMATGQCPGWQIA